MHIRDNVLQRSENIQLNGFTIFISPYKLYSVRINHKIYNLLHGDIPS